MVSATKAAKQPRRPVNNKDAPQGILATVVYRIHAILTTLLLHLLALGPIPRHVGFVMDGNRRYARVKGMKATQGHHDGFHSLKRTLEVCLKLKIRAVSVYAFAIDNFNREETEVEALMKLARTRLLELCQHGDLLHEHGVQVRFVGRREMLPDQVQEAIVKMEALTVDNTEGVLNVCCPYSSRDEIVHAVRKTVDDARENNLTVTDEMVFSNLETCQATKPIFHNVDGGKLDILVRTSNVKRLSDFMMWQADNDTQLHFVKTNWPEFGLTDILPILLGWQQKVWLRSLGW